MTSADRRALVLGVCLAAALAAAVALAAAAAPAAQHPREVAITFDDLSADAYVGTGGITWLHRWALSRGMPKAFFAGEPETPAFVAGLARP